MIDNKFQKATFSVVLAKNQDVGEEWNGVQWDNRHEHIGYHRLYFLTEGEATIYLIDRTVKLKPGYVYFIPAHSVKKSHIDGVMNKYYLHFQTDIPSLSLYRYISKTYSVRSNEMTEPLFKTVVENYAKGDITSRFKVQGAMNLLLADFLAELSVKSPVLKRFEEVIAYIDENYMAKISLSDLADLMNLSTAYFANFFKSTFNISPKQYLLNKRLTEGQRLLLQTDMTVKEIAFAVGFENENYFSEYFTQKVGISPKGFRTGTRGAKSGQK